MMQINKKQPFLFVIFFMLLHVSAAAQQHSVARKWNEVLLIAIRNDLARPTVHARNLWHLSTLMYDAWAAYEADANTFFLGQTTHNYHCAYNGIPLPLNKQTAQEEAISYAAYRLLRHRFQNSPGAFVSFPQFDSLFIHELGYDPTFHDTDYSTGSAAALGNYLAQQMIAFGLQDGSNEQSNYANTYYSPKNPPLLPIIPGNPDIIDPNSWQPLTLNVFIDQAGNIYPINTPPFLSPEWGNVVPFALDSSAMTTLLRNGNNYNVYHSIMSPPRIDTLNGGTETDNYKWGFRLVSKWSAHLDPSDSVLWDISPNAIGNIPWYPSTIDSLIYFYDEDQGGDHSRGYTVNPVTGQPYPSQIVPRADYARVLAEFWADGPDSETPPGHWFTILNYVIDHPLFEKRWKGQGPPLDDLEWDVKAYFTLSGTMHDGAVAAWALKGYEDYIRPISAIRYLAMNGQSTDTTLPSYSINGIEIDSGYVELVDSLDPLVGTNYEHYGKIKLRAWAGPDYISDPLTDVAGVRWILAENWWPYQRPSFVTPNFAGFVSGHSTYSRAAADVITLMTGSPYFPGGLGEFVANQNDFLVFEQGPSTNVVLQWVSYRDASDQCSLSRIWGGIHPPADDIPGRLLGMQIAIDAYELARSHWDNAKADVVQCSLSDTIITDADVGNQLDILVVFDENMDTSNVPTILFPVEDPSNTLVFSHSNWVNAYTCQLSYDILDANEQLAWIDLEISGGRNAVGVTQTTFTKTDFLTIDTRNPIVNTLAPSVDTISNMILGQNFKLYLKFDELMDTNTNPIITFPVEDPLAVALTLIGNQSRWITKDSFVAVYEVNMLENLPNIDVQIAQAVDSLGNNQIIATFNDLFSIEGTIDVLTTPLLVGPKLRTNPLRLGESVQIEMGDKLSGTVQLILYDVNGYILWQGQQSAENLLSFKLSGIPKGAYFIELRQASFKWKEKLILVD